ncbi:hypothetical protein ROZALSC1DRAFT_25420, partial [Rozella allomycis CSF55]
MVQLLGECVLQNILSHLKPSEICKLSNLNSQLYDFIAPYRFKTLQLNWPVSRCRQCLETLFSSYQDYKLSYVDELVLVITSSNVWSNKVNTVLPYKFGKCTKLRFVFRTDLMSEVGRFVEEFTGLIDLPRLKNIVVDGCGYNAREIIKICLSLRKKYPTLENISCSTLVMGA